MKYLLTIILLMSVNVFADFSITTLSCKKIPINEAGQFETSGTMPETLGVRIDERRETIRVNLLPESKLRKTNLSFRSSFIHSDLVYSVDVLREGLGLLFKYKLDIDNIDSGLNKPKSNKETKATYSCKII